MKFAFWTSAFIATVAGCVAADWAANAYWPGFVVALPFAFTVPWPLLERKDS